MGNRSTFIDIPTMLFPLLALGATACTVEIRGVDWGKLQIAAEITSDVPLVVTTSYPSVALPATTPPLSTAAYSGSNLTNNNPLGNQVVSPSTAILPSTSASISVKGVGTAPFSAAISFVNAPSDLSSFACAFVSPSALSNCLATGQSIASASLSSPGVQLSVYPKDEPSSATATNLLSFLGLGLRQISNTSGAQATSDGLVSMAVLPGGSKLVFGAVNGAVPGSGSKVMTYDGTAIQVVSDTSAGHGSDNPLYFAPVGTRLFFVSNAWIPSITVSRLFSYDGTTVKQESNVNAFGDNISDIVGDDVGGVYFSGFNTTFYRLSASGGSVTSIANMQQIGYSNSGMHWENGKLYGLSMVYDPATSTPTQLNYDVMSWNGELYGWGKVGGFYKVWKYDGTTWSQISNINPGANDGFASRFHDHQGRAYFSGLDSAGHTKLFSFDGSTFRQVSDLQPGGNDDPAGFVSYGGNLYFQGRNSSNFWKLFVLTPTGISQVTDTYPAGNDTPGAPVVFQNKLFFSSFVSATSNKLFSLCDPSQGCTP